MFERETRREKILEARNKELRLKEKTKGILGLGGGLMGATGGINFFFISKIKCKMINTLKRSRVIQGAPD